MKDLVIAAALVVVVVAFETVVDDVVDVDVV